MVTLPEKLTKEEHGHHHFLEPPGREHVKQTPREQEAIRPLALEAYVQFLDSLFSYYESVTGVVRSRGEAKSRSPDSEA